MTRREAREALFVLLYEMSFNQANELEDTIERAAEERGIGKDDDEYTIPSIHGIYENLGEIDSLISSKAHGWKLERLSRVSLAIMRLSVYEMLYTKIPYNVSINEAVELAKKFDHEQAPAFINGILNAIAEEKGLKSAQ